MNLNTQHSWDVPQDTLANDYLSGAAKLPQDNDDFQATVTDSYLSRVLPAEFALADSTPSLRRPYAIGKAAIFAMATVFPSQSVPVIGHNVATVINSAGGRLAWHSYRADSLTPDGITSSGGSPLASFILRNPAELNSYISNNHDLSEHISRLGAYLQESSQVDVAELELYTDIEEHWQKIFVFVHPTSEDENIIDTLEDQLFAEFFEPYNNFLAGRLVLSIG